MTTDAGQAEADVTPTEQDAQPGDGSGQDGAAADADEVDAAYAAMPALQEPTAPVFDPKLPTTSAEAEKNQANIKSGVDFNNLKLLPTVKTVSQRVADEAVLTATEMTLPIKGNEALLQLKKGAVLTGGRGDSARRGATKSNNLFGFMRKMKSVKKVGDRIVLQTETAQLQDVFSGAIHISTNLTETADIDVGDMDLRKVFPGLDKSYKPGGTGKFEQKQGAWGKDGLLAGFQFKRGRSYSFPVKIEGKVGSETISLDGAFEVKAQMGMELGIGYGFDINTPVDFWNSSLNYLRVWAGGSFFAETGFSLDVVAKGSGVGEKFKQALAIAQIDNPFEPPSIPNSFTVGEFGPKQGPTIWVVPTTFFVEVIATCTLNVSSSIKVDVEAGVKGEAKFGLEYTKKNGFQPINSVKFEKWKKFNISNGRLSGTVTCEIGPKIHWLIGGTAGPYIDARAGARANLTFASECKDPKALAKSGPPPATLSALLEVGFNIDLGGSIQINYKGDTLWSYDFGSVPMIGKWWTLWKKTFDLGAGYGQSGTSAEKKQIPANPQS